MREVARMNIYTDLDNETRDMLAELGNIGTGNAVSSLSAMMGHVIEIGIPSIRLVRYQDVFETLGISADWDTGSGERGTAGDVFIPDRRSVYQSNPKNDAG